MVSVIEAAVLQAIDHAHLLPPLRMRLAKVCPFSPIVFVVVCSIGVDVLAEGGGGQVMTTMPIKAQRNKKKS